MNELDPRPVVVAVDSADDFDAALRFGAAEAATQGCGLLLVHAYHVLPTGPDAPLLEFEVLDDLATANLRAAVEHATNMLHGQVPVTSRLIRGPIVQSIVDASADARLIVVQRRDRSRAERVVTRSTSSGVAARAHVPVVSVPTGWTGDSGPGGVVTVGVDVPTRSHALLREALLAARARQASLRVAHTWWVPGYYDDIIMNRLGGEGWVSETAGEIQDELALLHDEFPDVPVQVDIQHGRPADNLLAASRTSSLLVVGRHDPLIPLGSHLGPVARAVLRDAVCPVLLAPPTQSHLVMARVAPGAAGAVNPV